MKKYIPLLLTTSLLLSACWVKQSSPSIEDIWTEMTSPVWEITTYSEVKTTQPNSTSEITQWNDFKIVQTNDETQALYKGKIIKTWSHTPSEKNPFIWDDACKNVWKEFEKINNEDDMSQKKQQIWNKLSLSDKKDCLKESLLSSIKFVTVNSRFTQIQQYGYEWFKGWWIYDTQSGNIQEIMRADGTIKSIEVSNTWIKITIENARWETQFTILNYDVKFKSLVSKKEV